MVARHCWMWVFYFVCLAFGCSTEKAPSLQQALSNVEPAVAPLADGGTVEVKSPYSHILVQKRGTVVSLSFVRDSGEVVLESKMDVAKSQNLLVAYTRVMFASYLFKPKQEQVLIVGLGGGSMVQFLKHHDPALRVDVIEIDPEIVKIAKNYFGVESKDPVRIFTVDGFQYLKDTQESYDVIYMDAFLKPSADTDSTGVPLAMKTQQFLRDIQTKLKPEGLVVFNLNTHASLKEDIKNIQATFAAVYFFQPPGSGNLVAVALKAGAAPTPEQLYATGQRMDEQWKATFSFAEMMKFWVQPR